MLMREEITARDADAFSRCTELFRGELLAHCNRMLGSVTDPDDPATIVARREGLRRAMIAGLHLPPRQRAVLILLNGFMKAFEKAAPQALAQLLLADLALEATPQRTWFAGLDRSPRGAAMSGTDDNPPESELDRAIEALRPDLLVYCYLMLGSMSQARDAVAGACRQAQQHYSAIPNPTTLRLWLYRTVTDTCFHDHDVVRPYGSRWHDDPNEEPRMTVHQLKPAAELAAADSRPFPNESVEHRDARTALLAEEIELRRHIQRVAAQRRALPPGGEANDYRFLDEQGHELRLVDLFGEHDTLFTYFWMYGPERERPCPMCTSLVGSLDIPALDIEQRIAVAIVGRSPVERQRDFARERGWRNLRFYQTVGDRFARDYRGLDENGSEGAIVAVWKREGDTVRLFWAAEGGFETADPGFDPHLGPDPTPLWNILDWTPAGRGTDWYPQLEYARSHVPTK